MPRLLHRIKISLSFILISASTLLLLLGCSAAEKGREFISEKLSSRDEMDAAVEVVDLFFYSIMKKDYESAYDLISESDKSMGDVQEFAGEFKDVTDIVKVEINWVEVNNNIATVGIDLIDTYDGEQKMYKDIEVSLVKSEVGNWKIVFWE